MRQHPFQKRFRVGVVQKRGIVGEEAKEGPTGERDAADLHQVSILNSQVGHHPSRHDQGSFKEKKVNKIKYIVLN